MPIDEAIFTSLQQKIDQEANIREKIRDALQMLERQDRNLKATLAKVHSTSTTTTTITTAGSGGESGNKNGLSAIVHSAESSIREAVTTTVVTLAEVTAGVPYYKFNGLWTRQIQDLVFSIIYCGWLGGFKDISGGGGGGDEEERDRLRGGKLLTIEQVGQIMQIPVNLKDHDAFHLTIEEYLQALISLVDELSRLSRNSVTLGDFRRPLQISQFIKDVFAGFQLLNLKNDSLRKRSDGLKYKVKDAEDVVYDLSLRNLIPRDAVLEA